MIAEISAGPGSLKAAKDIVQAMNGIQTAAAINDVKLTLQGHILDAQQGLFTAQEAQATAARHISDLEQQIVQLKDWSAEKKRYQLQAVYRGTFAYALKAGMENDEPAHWLCANCFDQGRKSFLQCNGQEYQAGRGLSRDSTYACLACKGTLKVNYNVNPDRPWTPNPPEA